MKYIYVIGSLSSMSLPGQVFGEDELKPMGKSFQSDNETLTTRTSGYTSGIVQDSDVDSFRHARSPRRMITDADNNERSSSRQSSSPDN